MRSDDSFFLVNPTMARSLIETSSVTASVAGCSDFGNKGRHHKIVHSRTGSGGGHGKITVEMAIIDALVNYPSYGRCKNPVKPSALRVYLTVKRFLSWGEPKSAEDMNLMGSSPGCTRFRETDLCHDY